jgi:RND family efflux transporter MFP subunit
MKRRLKAMFRLIAVLVPLAFFLTLQGCGHADETEDHRTPVKVRTATVAETETNDWVEAVGTVRSIKEAMIAGKVMGTVTEIRKSAGESVRKGEVLIVIDSRDVAGQISQAQGALAQAQAAVALAETNFHRFERLHTKGSASDLELDQARFQFETAKGAVEQAEGALKTARSYQSYAEIAAPFDGRVVDRHADVGDLAAPGHPLMTIEGEGRKRLMVSLDADRVSVATVGKSVRVEIPSLGDRTIEGTVAEIVPAADPATHSFLVKIDLQEDPALRAGLYGRAIFPGGERRALLVPRSAIHHRGGLTGVLVVESDRVTFRLVTVKQEDSDPIEILSGLSPGESIIIAAPATLEIGSPVEVQG